MNSSVIVMPATKKCQGLPRVKSFSRFDCDCTPKAAAAALFSALNKPGLSGDEFSDIAI